MDALVLENFVIHKEDIEGSANAVACSEYLAQFQLD
jgi:hypothetical protein